jgi:hypothetical protein
LNFIFGIVCLFVCVCAFSLRRESPDMILGDKPLIFEVVLSQSGSGYVARQHLQGCNPCLCQLRTVRLAPESKYWMYRSYASDMSPINLVVGCQHEFNFSPLLFGCCGREAGYGPTDRMFVVLWIESGALLLGCSGSIQICWWLYERLLYVDRVRYVWS